MKIIRALSVHSFIVNQVASDGTEEFFSTMMQMATIKAKDVFQYLSTKYHRKQRLHLNIYVIRISMYSLVVKFLIGLRNL